MLRTARRRSYLHVLQPSFIDVQPLPVSHAKVVQKMLSGQLWLPVHVTSQAHELPHATLRHDDGPEHEMSHGPAPHAMLLHD
jgi:hypothetical protein